MTRCRGLLLCVALCIVPMTIGCGLFGSKTPSPRFWPKDDLATIYPDDGKENLYTRGMSERAITHEITYERAKSNAQAAMAERLKLSVAKLLKDWMSTSEDLADPSSPAGQRYTEIVSRKFTTANLYGCHEVKWAEVPETRAIWSLMRMPLKGNSALRNEIRRQAEDELRKAEKGVVTGEIDAAIKSLDEYLAREAAKQ